jgi:hypothetical protein
MPFVIDNLTRIHSNVNELTKEFIKIRMLIQGLLPNTTNNLITEINSFKILLTDLSDNWKTTNILISIFILLFFLTIWVIIIFIYLYFIYFKKNNNLVINYEELKS